MKLLDRYVISAFLKNYAISFMVLVGLYVVLDMVFKFDEMVEFKTVDGPAGASSVLGVLWRIGDYYLHQTFLFFVQLSGIIPVVAAAFTLLRLSRFNELTAIMAAGVPLQRVALPVVVIGAAINLVLLPINQELIVPAMIPKLMRSLDDLQQDDPRGFTVTGMRDEANRLVSVARYTPPGGRAPARMEFLDILERDDRLRVTAHVTADAGVWDEAGQQWRLTNGRRVTGVGPDGPPPAEEAFEVYKSSITPQEVALYRSGDYIELLSTRRINQLLERPKSYGTANLLRVKHMRFTQPLMNVIILLLAIPCVLTREPGRLKHAASLCLLLTGLCMGSVFLFQQMAANNLLGPAWADQWPALMAWAPILIWGPIGVWLLDRTET